MKLMPPNIKHVNLANMNESCNMKAYLSQDSVATDLRGDDS